MARIQFCRVRPRGRVLRSPAGISRRTRHVGTRGAKCQKKMFELADCLHSIRTRTKGEALPYDCKSAALDLLFLGTESVTKSNRWFTQLNSAHSSHSGI